MTKKIKKNDRVAIVSPSSPVAGVFPWVFEQGLERLRTIFNLEPVVMPHCLNTKATQANKASDLHEAFTNSEIQAVISCTGGNDQIQLIKLLDAKIFRDNPKPFFGYSDNTHLCNFLYGNGVKSFYGGSLLSQFAMQHQMCQETIDSLNWALFDSSDWFDIKAASYCIDEDHPWDDPKYLSIPRIREPNDDGLVFEGTQTAEGILWGGCLECLSDLMRVHERVPRDFSDIVIFLETSEEIPSHELVRRFMVSLGEAGILSQIQGLIVGRPKTWFFDNKMAMADKRVYRQKQAEIISAVMKSYNASIPVVMNVGIGHTDPQLVLPYGGRVKINGSNKKMSVIFGALEHGSTRRDR